jgi:hypothetical protein
MEGMIEFAKNNRTTRYFRDYAIEQIRIAYRIMEYLLPDGIFIPKDLDNDTKELILREKFEDAFNKIEYEISIRDLGSSCGYESLKAEAIELMGYLLPIYKKDVKNAKEKRRLELLEELKTLNEGGE